MILKLIVKNHTAVPFGGTTYSELMNVDPIEVDYGNGEKGEITDLYNYISKEYDRGEYILKFKNIKDFGLREFGDFEIEILQWGKILEKNEENIIQISNISKIYEPEPDRIPIEYEGLKLTELPEWLFSKKVTSTVMSTFKGCKSLTSIPEGLFKNNVNVISFGYTFLRCKGLTSIPEGLFKNNVNVKNFDYTFSGCSGLTSIPEGLFKNNVNVITFSAVFSGCSGLTSIPEGLFKNNVNVIALSGVFSGCKGLTSISEGLFKNNVNITGFGSAFSECSGLTSIPEELFKNNVNVISFDYTFSGCKGLTSIPGGLFKNNVNIINFDSVFLGCSGITSIPEVIVEFAKKVKEKGGYTYHMFAFCTSASNYSSIPDYMK